MKNLRPLLMSTSLLALCVAGAVQAQVVVPPVTPEPAVVPLIEVAPSAQSEPELAPESLDTQAPEEGEDTEAIPDADMGAEPDPIVRIAIPAVWAPVPRDREGRSAFGQYLAGRFALLRGASGEAATYLSRARDLDPAQPLLSEQLFTAALMSGQVERASTSIPSESQGGEFMVQAARLTVPVQLMAQGDARRANAALKANPVAMPHLRAGIYLHPWIAGAAGDWDQAFAPPPANLDVVSLLLARANRAQVLEKRRRFDEAEAEWKELTSHAVASRLFRLPYGEFLERRKRRDEAIVQYEAAVTAGAGERKIYMALNRARHKERAPALPDWKTGAALALTTAADQASAQEAHQYGLVYLRLAQALNPSPELAFQLGHVLRQSKQEIEARTVLASIGTENPSVYGAARLQMALSYEAEGRLDEALLEIERAIVEVPTDRSLAYMHTNLLMQAKRLDEALAVVNGPLLNTPDQGFDIRFLRGAVLSEMRRYDEAEAELWAAKQLQPDNAMVLNHLGYLWVDQGTRVEEGAALIARAHAADPRDGNIQDSLGWAQFRQGLFDEAVVNLEEAVAKEPANPEINDHLGDAYWMIGRHREAGFQWARVLTLKAEDERRTAVEAKLKLEPGQALPDASKVVAE